MSVETGKPPIEEVIAALATLPRLKYEQVREEKAKELNIRVTILDEEVAALRPDAETGETPGRVVEFPDRVEYEGEVIGCDVLEEALTHITRHMHMDFSEAVTCALWAAHTYVFNGFSHTPRLLITAPDAACGKTVLLHHLIGNLSNRPLCTEDVSPAVYFRVAEEYQPTFLIDEADAWLKQDAQFFSSFNSGFEPGGMVMRCVTVNNEITVRGFRTFAPTALAGIEVDKKVKASQITRSMVITLERASEGDIALEDIWDREEHEAAVLITASKLAKWTRSHAVEIKAAKPDTPLNLRDRDKDKWRPLLKIAEVAGGRWPELAIRAFYASVERLEPTKNEQFLLDIRDAIRSDSKIFTETLIDRMCSLDDSPYLDYNFKKLFAAEKRIQPQQLSNRLRKYHVKPKLVRMSSDKNPLRGYDCDELRKVINKYVRKFVAEPPIPPTDSDDLSIGKKDSGGEKPHPPYNVGVTPLQTCCDGTLGGFPPVTGIFAVTGSDDLKPSPHNDCNGVTGRNGKPPESHPPTAKQPLLPMLIANGAKLSIDGDKLMWSLPSTPDDAAQKWFAQNEQQIIAELRARDAADQEILNP